MEPLQARISKLKVRAGFTLIELLTVIAIIALLAAIILASLNTARSRSRDAKRVADLKSIELALSLYYNDNGQYPSILSQLAPTYISTIPADPLGAPAVYVYAGTANAAGGTCSGYHLGATLEQQGASALSSASQSSAGAYCTNNNQNSLPDFIGSTATYCPNSGVTSGYCYDIHS